jgi:hypothetical protein
VRILNSTQLARVADPVRSKLAMVAPILEATLYSLALERVTRLGGHDRITLGDLAREFRDSPGDVGICFEYAVHEAITSANELIHPLASEVLEEFCAIPGGAHSLLFGPEKDGRIPILETVRDSLTEEARVYVGNRGQPPKLRRYIPKIIRAFRRNEERNKLPRSINGLWKADLFIGNANSEKWVGTTVKINPDGLEGAQGLRIGIYPRKTPSDRPREDSALNLIRLPLPYDAAFMELYYKSFFLTRAFLHADARVPAPVALPDAEDRFVTQELEARRAFPIFDVLDVVRQMSQQDLLRNDAVQTVMASATLSEASGLQQAVVETGPEQTGAISVTPQSLTTEKG